MPKTTWPDRGEVMVKEFDTMPSRTPTLSRRLKNVISLRHLNGHQNDNNIEECTERPSSASTTKGFISERSSDANAVDISPIEIAARPKLTTRLLKSISIRNINEVFTSAANHPGKPEMPSSTSPKSRAARAKRNAKKKAKKEAKLEGVVGDDKALESPTKTTLMGSEPTREGTPIEAKLHGMDNTGGGHRDSIKERAADNNNNGLLSPVPAKAGRILATPMDHIEFLPKFTRNVVAEQFGQTVTTLELDLWKPGVSSEPKRGDIFSASLLLPLCNMRQLRILKISSMLDSYQKVIFQAVWLMPHLQYLKLEMTRKPKLKQGEITKEWKEIKGAWQMKKFTKGNEVYHGENGRGTLAFDLGHGEYLDTEAIGQARLDATSMGTVNDLLSVVTLELHGFVMDSGPFHDWFDPAKLKEIMVMDDCIDAGFGLNEEFRIGVAVSFPPEQESLRLSGARRYTGFSYKVVDMKQPSAQAKLKRNAELVQAELIKAEAKAAKEHAEEQAVSNARAIAKTKAESDTKAKPENIWISRKPGEPKEWLPIELEAGEWIE